MMSSSMDADDAAKTSVLTAPPKKITPPPWRPSLHLLEPVVIPLSAILLAFVLFSIFILLAGANPITSLQLMYTGSVGTSFSIQNTLIRAAPLMLTGLCAALPLQLGMVIIGGEGALVLGGLAAAGAAHLLPESTNPWISTFVMIAAATVAGGLWIALPGFLKYYRGVNETISSLLLNYIAIAILNEMVEGLMHDPESLNTPSTFAIPDASMIGTIGTSNVHYGFIWGLVLCLVLYVLMNHTIIGFAAKIVGGNMRAARVAGLSVGKLTVGISMLAGAAAGLAGMVEVAAVQGRANANLTAPGYGYTGILVAFIARGNPLAVIPVSLLLGGIGASGGLLQRRQHLPDATVQVFQGILFIVILAFETMYGRFGIFRRKEAKNV